MNGGAWSASRAKQQEPHRHVVCRPMRWVALPALVALCLAASAPGGGSVGSAACPPNAANRLGSTGPAAAARHGRRRAAQLDAGNVPALAQGRPLLARGRRPLDCVARPARRLGEQARGRPHDPGRPVRLRPRHVRDRAEPRCPLRLPPDRLRRLVGRGSELALLQPLPPRALRLEPAVPGHERGPLALADRVSPLRGDRLQRRGPSSPVAARESSSTPARAGPRSVA